MTHYVQVVGNEIKQVWDTPPSEGVGNNGWRNAVEVRPAITAHRQGLVVCFGKQLHPVFASSLSQKL